ncbi:MAG: class I SAM-dependent RNA methyltransferase [Rhizobiales bacterium]|nr:class I SAM-dependent RNA methyltransferase [Hyphomicrobiales bacterium]
MAETLLIDHVGQRGDGVARVDGAARYVSYTLPGETVDAAPLAASDRMQLIAIRTPSPQRIDPLCAHFGVCGGCATQHWRAEAYRKWKRQLVVDTLVRAGIDVEVADLIDAHGAGRRRVTLHARRAADGSFPVGFAAPNSHAVIAIDACPILDPALGGALDAARALAALLKPVAKPLDIQITAADNGLDVDVRGSGPLPPRIVATLSQLAEQYKLARLTRHGELVLMRTPPLVIMGAASVPLPPGSFLQATVAGEETLATLAVTHCGKAKRIADLFCGVGPFALRLAAKARVTAFDSDAGAIASLQKAAASAHGLKPIAAEARDLFRRPLVPQELRDVDAVVFDPPRQGAEAQSKQLAASKVPVIVAVSCNVTTFARDARILIDGGYRIETVTPVDQFRHTPHVELVARFVR